MRVRAGLGLALVGLVSVLALGMFTATQAQETRYWAVAAGISDYRFINDLNYCDDDAMEFAAALSGYSEWSGLNQVEVLVDSQASKNGLHDAIERMGQKANGNTGDHDVCVVWFSGHGTQVDDRSGEETDLYDEAICAWDTRIYWHYMRGVITDDELGDWLTALLPGDADIICILDTCFSGGLAKGVGGKQVKFIRNPNVSSRAKPRRRFAQGLMGKLAGRTGGASVKGLDGGATKDISGAKAVVLMASEEGWSSYEDPVLQHGVFSYYVIEGLSTESATADANSNDELSAEEEFAYAGPLTESYTFGWQVPQLYDGNPATETTLALLGTDRAPSLSLTAPLDGATVSGTVDITAVATDDVGIQRVDFYVDGGFLGSDTTPDPGDIYTSSWDTTCSDEGGRVITVTAVDMGGHETSVSVDVTVDNWALPQVSVTGPTDGSEVSGMLDIQASATAASGCGILGVRFYVDDIYLGEDASAPYLVKWDTSLDSNGYHTLKVIVEDNKGQSAEDSITVRVNNAVPGMVLSVDSINVTLQQRRSLCYGIATVVIRDNRGRPASRARVSGYWSGGPDDTDSGLTDENGMFTCRSRRLRRPPSGTVFCFTVNGVSLPDATWDGIIESDEAMVP